MEGHAEHLDEKVDCVAAQVALGPAPIRVFDDEPGECGQQEVAAALFDELEPAFFEQGHEGRHAGGANLFPAPPRRCLP